MMHLYKNMRQSNGVSSGVLILVVMDDALVQFIVTWSNVQEFVLILVVMDDALVQADKRLFSCH